MTKFCRGWTTIVITWFSLLFATGCTPFVRTHTIEEIAPVIIWSVKEGGNNHLSISTVVPPIVPEKKQVLTVQADLLEQGGKRFNLKYEKELVSGQVRMVFIDEQLARKGIGDLINTMMTDPDISPRLFIVVVRGDFDGFLRQQLERQKALDYSLYLDLRHYAREQSEISMVDLHEFTKKLYSPFSSPIAPIFKVEPDTMTYEGTAVFSHDKLFTSLSQTDDELFQLLQRDSRISTVIIPELSIALGHVRSHVQTNLNQNRSKISIRVDLYGRIQEYNGTKNLADAIELDSLNAEVESYLQRHTAQLLTSLQQQRLDPLQLGTLTLHPFSPPMTEDEWLYRWENLKVHVDYHLHLDTLTNVTA
uniref:Ger(x)C family spore germination protein n=1 Tax=Alicyclobacillus tolerans TaxID=90970 RepID=UPI0040381420